MSRFKVIDLLENVVSGEWGQEPTGSNDVKVIRTTNFSNDGRLDLNKEIVFRNIEQQKAIEKKLNYGDIIIEKSGGSPEQPVGRVVYFDIKNDIYLCNNFTSILRPDSNKVINKYLFYYLFYKYKTKAVLKYQNKTTGIINLKLDNYLKSLSIDLPSKETQLKIVSILDKTQELIDKRKTQIEALDQLTQSVFLEMFGDPVKNNKNWVMQKLSETGELKRGISKYRPRNAPELLNGPYPLIQTGDVANSGIFIKKYNQTYSELGLKQSKMWPKGTLCITIAANIAQTGILTFDACFPDSVVAYIPKNYMSNIYVHFWFTFLQRIIEANAPESAQKNINLKILSELEIPVPPVELQNKFVEIVEKIESQKDLLQKSLEELENNFNSLMQRAFKGELFND
ncbi:restriction endonuclease subunit S [Geobacillus sp. C56-T2]|uniref:restriction endonuclease subunit S n=1 Tax=Geobacillus sp. C56-T2 TaxID=600773 RepID=UPI0011A356CF|nr:restriction endonuclease subunit S [Geobacillus sp. C56-T2]NNV06696.1 restriction endonuclease subunit S [Geobacillus sp. MMMUD3]TWG29428.1 type I restriction enzyme S subunit [Geobacillus sp. C56-T2]